MISEKPLADNDPKFEKPDINGVLERLYEKDKKEGGLYNVSYIKISGFENGVVELIDRGDSVRLFMRIPESESGTLVNCARGIGNFEDGKINYDNIRNGTNLGVSSLNLNINEKIAVKIPNKKDNSCLSNTVMVDIIKQESLDDDSANIQTSLNFVLKNICHFERGIIAPPEKELISEAASLYGETEKKSLENFSDKERKLVKGAVKKDASHGYQAITIPGLAEHIEKESGNFTIVRTVSASSIPMRLDQKFLISLHDRVRSGGSFNPDDIEDVTLIQDFLMGGADFLYTRIFFEDALDDQKMMWHDEKEDHEDGALIIFKKNLLDRVDREIHAKDFYGNIGFMDDDSQLMMLVRQQAGETVEGADKSPLGIDTDGPVTPSEMARLQKQTDYKKFNELLFYEGVSVQDIDHVVVEENTKTKYGLVSRLASIPGVEENEIKQFFFEKWLAGPKIFMDWYDSFEIDGPREEVKSLLMLDPRMKLLDNYEKTNEKEINGRPIYEFICYGISEKDMLPLS